MEPYEFKLIAKLTIESLYPSATRPDESNILSNGIRYRAPDYRIDSEKILIELKSLNPVKNPYEVLQKIATKQGKPFRAYGEIATQSVLQNLPNAMEANRNFKTTMLKQLEENIRSAAEQFKQYQVHCPMEDYIRIIIITDNDASGAVDTNSHEYEIGRLMGGTLGTSCKSGLTDAIVYLRSPNYVLTGDYSYWMKVICKSGKSENSVIDQFIRQFHTLLTEKLFVNKRDPHANLLRILRVNKEGSLR